MKTWFNEQKSIVPILQLDWNVFADVIKTIGSLPAESGGAIGGYETNMEVSHYHFDTNSRTSSVTYSPDHNFLNHLFHDKWNPHGIRFRGFIHSHPGHMSRPSFGDEAYAERILSAINDLEYLWLPIVNTVADTGAFHFTPWAVHRTSHGVKVVPGKIQVINLTSESSLTVGGVRILDLCSLEKPVDKIVIGHVQEPPSYQRIHHQPHSVTTTFDVHNTFDRVRGAYDLEIMRKARIIAVGAGGAAAWLEDIARAGVGQFVMIDPDTVSETNLATQQTYRRDIDRPKVDCIAERIRDINPTTKTIALQKSLDDIQDSEMRGLAMDPIDGRNPGQTILCGLTDNFQAQARINRLALHLGIPSLSAQVYKEGRGAEITFTYPGVTPACHRCILSSRYRHFLGQGQQNDVTSHGTPIFATTRLNAIKGFLLLALLHHGTDHPRWGQLLTRIGKRNLIQLRMDPDLSTSLGLNIFDKVLQQADQERIFMDDVVWLPQDHECPETGYPHCPDCGGTGNLRDSIGLFYDTKFTTKKTNFSSSSYNSQLQAVAN